jgi:hypothetical protein
MPRSRPCNFELHHANGKDDRMHGLQNQEMAARISRCSFSDLTTPHGRRHVARSLPCDAAASMCRIGLAGPLPRG